MLGHCSAPQKFVGCLVGKRPFRKQEPFVRATPGQAVDPVGHSLAIAAWGRVRADQQGELRKDAASDST